jgi:hypothetical protein
MQNGSAAFVTVSGTLRSRRLTPVQGSSYSMISTKIQSLCNALAASLTDEQQDFASGTSDDPRTEASVTGGDSIDVEEEHTPGWLMECKVKVEKLQEEMRLLGFPDEETALLFDVISMFKEIEVLGQTERFNAQIVSINEARGDDQAHHEPIDYEEYRLEGIHDTMAFERDVFDVASGSRKRQKPSTDVIRVTLLLELAHACSVHGSEQAKIASDAVLSEAEKSWYGTEPNPDRHERQSWIRDRERRQVITSRIADTLKPDVPTPGLHPESRAWQGSRRRRFFELICQVFMSE